MCPENKDTARRRQRDSVSGWLEKNQPESDPSRATFVNRVIRKRLKDRCERAAAHFSHFTLLHTLALFFSKVGEHDS